MVAIDEAQLGHAAAALGPGRHRVAGLRQAELAHPLDEAVGLFLDYSKNRITGETLNLLVRLAEEYFGDLSGHLFGAQWGLKALASTKLGAALSGKAIRHQVEQMATSFIAGASIEQAVPALRKLWDDGRAFSVDLLGEASVNEREADAYRDRCLAALRILGDVCPAWSPSPWLQNQKAKPNRG